MHNTEIQESAAKSPVRELAGNKNLGGAVTGVVILLFLFQMIKMGHAIGVYEQMYYDLGAEISAYALTNLVLSTRILS